MTSGQHNQKIELKLGFHITGSVPDSTLDSACVVTEACTPQTSVSINRKRRKQHPRQCWGSGWGMYMYGRLAADTP